MRFFGRLEIGHVQNVEQQHGIISHGGAAGFGDDVRMRDVFGRQRFGDRFDHVHAIFVERVIAAGGIIGVGAVVIDREPAAEVEEPHGSTFLDQSGIDPAGFEHAGTDVADVRDLRADMVMEQTQTVEHFGFLELVHDAHEFGGIEAEHAAVAARFGPLSAGPGGKFHADADHRLDAEFPAPFDDDRHFAGHFHDEDALDAQLGGIKREIDEFLILVTVADETGFMVGHGADGGNEFGFAAGFETMMEFASETGDLLHDLLLLIDLDRINTAVLSLKTGLFDRFRKGRMQQTDLSVEDIAQTEQHRHVHAAFLDALDDLHQTDCGSVLAESGNGQLAFGIDIEITCAPVADAVKIRGIPRSPVFKCLFANIHRITDSFRRT